MIQITLSYPDAASAAAALTRLSSGTISPLDNPSVGAEVDPRQTPLALAQPAPKSADNWSVDPATLFGGAVAPIPPAPHGTVTACVPPLAPSTAGAVATTSAPVALPAGLPPQPSAASLPVPPAPTAAAPTAPVAPTIPASGAERDSSGLPWDSRIHAANRSTNKDGTWRQRRGTNDEAMVKRVEAELRATVAGVAAAPVPVPVPPTPAAAMPAPPAPAPAVAPPPAPVTGAATEDFGALMGFLAPHLARDFVGANAKISAILAPLGVAGIGALSAVPALIPTVRQQVEAAFA